MLPPLSPVVARWLSNLDPVALDLAQRSIFTYQDCKDLLDAVSGAREQARQIIDKASAAAAPLGPIVAYLRSARTATSSRTTGGGR